MEISNKLAPISRRKLKAVKSINIFDKHPLIDKLVNRKQQINRLHNILISPLTKIQHNLQQSGPLIRVIKIQKFVFAKENKRISELKIVN